MRLTYLALAAMIAEGLRRGLASLPESPYNDPDFHPTHPTPVLYVHGFTLNAISLASNARYLRDHGYWTWGWDYGVTERASLAGLIPLLHGLGDLNDLVAELAQNVEKVKDATGSDKVDIVAHSQGGLLTRLYIGTGGAGNVRRVVAIGANFHGTDLSGLLERLEPLIARLPRLARTVAGVGALQQLAGSTFFEDYQHVKDSDPRIVYTSIYTPADRTVTPSSASILESVDGADVVNINLDEAYPGFPPVSHFQLTRDPHVAELTLWGLERESDAPA